MPDVIVLFGGPSPERKVSVASAQHVASVLEEAEAWFWAVEGGIHRVDRVALLAHEKPFETEFVPRSKASFASLEAALDDPGRSEEHTSELQSRRDLVCRLLLE